MHTQAARSDRVKGLVERLMRTAFARPRDPRSAEYRAGAEAVLAFRAGVALHVCCPYPVGTAQADAWFAGTDEGHAIWRRHIEGKAS